MSELHTLDETPLRVEEKSEESAEFIQKTKAYLNTLEWSINWNSTNEQE